MRRHWRIGFALAAVVGAFLCAPACGIGGVGDPCIPEEEFFADFNQFDLKEVNVESRSFQCETRVCLVNHFTGRVSCPYGQTQDEIDSLPPAAAERCRIPGSQDPIQVPVEPQFEDRRAEDAVYCSCRCDGPDPNARYCDCPDGFSCTELIDDLGLGRGQLAGSYCVRDGTKFDPNQEPTQRCSGSACPTEGQDIVASANPDCRNCPDAGCGPCRTDSQ